MRTNKRISRLFFSQRMLHRLVSELESYQMHVFSLQQELCTFHPNTLLISLPFASMSSVFHLRFRDCNGGSHVAGIRAVRETRCLLKNSPYISSTDCHGFARCKWMRINIHRISPVWLPRSYCRCLSIAYRFYALHLILWYHSTEKLRT